MILGALQLGFVYALLSLGVFVAFRVMQIPDLTADGSFTLGMSASVMLASAGHPLLGLALGLCAGAAAGAATGLLQTKAGIHPILAGILTMTGLYSVNLGVMGGRPNVSLLGKETLFTLAQPLLGKSLSRFGTLLALAALAVIALAWFFRTGFGLRIRAAGSNEQMVRSSSINTDAVRIAGLAVANGAVGLSGAALAQYQGYGDINAGTGVVIVGLASVILGELFPFRNSMFLKLTAAALGAVLYRILIAAVLRFNVFPAYFLRLLSAAIVALALALPRIRGIVNELKRRRKNNSGIRSA